MSLDLCVYIFVSNMNIFTLLRKLYHILYAFYVYISSSIIFLGTRICYSFAHKIVNKWNNMQTNIIIEIVYDSLW